MLEQIRATLLEEYSVSQWVLLFFLYSFCGWCWEVFLYLVKERRFVNRGFLFGPILPIYGFGAVGILLTCVPVEGNMALVALVGTIAASLLEYVTGFLMETIFHVRYWDYSERPLNLNGYICALSAATWAVFSVFIVSVVNPFVKTYIYMIPLTMADAAHRVLGTRTMTSVTKGLHALGLPQWLPSMPRAYRMPDALRKTPVPEPDKVVYFPSCINQTMGLARETPVAEPLADKMVALLRKAGYEVIFPENMERLCCGTIWESKGMADIADRKTAELEEALWRASEEGRWPVLCDQSPCLHRMREKIGRMRLYEPAEFIWTFLRDRLEFRPQPGPVAVHVTCSMRRMGLDGVIVALARLCADEVVVPEEVGCCGFAGDRGFTHPEVNAYALRKLRPVVERSGVRVGYSNSRTCEIGLSARSGVPYVSIVYLVDACTTPKENPGA